MDAPTSAVCAGCGKPGRNHGFGRDDNGLTTIDLAPGHTALVCHSARDRKDPVESCATKARVAAPWCRGCGQEFVGDWRFRYDGDALYSVCVKCAELLERGRAAPPDTARAWYTLDIENQLPHSASYDEQRMAFDAFADALAAYASERRTPPDDVPFAGIIPANGLTRYGEVRRTVYNGRSVELTASQAVAMEKVLATLKTLLDHAYADGLQNGRSLLRGLANGEITMAQYDDRTVKMVAEERKRRGET